MAVTAAALAAVSLAAILYCYVGYPLVLMVLRLSRRCRARPRARTTDGKWPSVSVIIPCYNEANVLGAKLARLSEIDYPPGRTEVIVVSDGSDDATADIAKASGVTRVIQWLDRRGKPAALNAGVAAATGEVLIFTDANAMPERGAFRALVAPFADPRVGGVAGEQIISAGGEGERWYWRYESWIKTMEADVGSVAGADGSLYAIRRDLYSPIPERRVVMDDFYLSLAVVRAGYQLTYVPEARAGEDALADKWLEFKRKARIMAGSLQALVYLGGGVWRRLAWQLFSHKVLRWFGPWLMAWALAGAAVGAAAGCWAAWAMLIPQVVFYLMGVLGLVFGKGAPAVFRGAAAFMIANAGLAMGWFKFVAGARPAAWEKLR